MALNNPIDMQPRGHEQATEPGMVLNAPPLQYLLAYQRFRAATARVEPLVAKLVAVSGRLQNSNWQRVAITNSAATFPVGLRVSVDTAGWPDIHQLAQAMADWHEARAFLYEAWEKVPKEHRGGLQPPLEEPEK